MNHSHISARSWRVLVGVITAGAAAAATALLAPSQAGAAPSLAWAGSWSASPVAGATSSTCPAGADGLTGQTVRNIVYPSVGGDRVRVRFSNVFGTAPLTIGAASIAVDRSGASVIGSTKQALTFGDKKTVTIPAGSEAVSDWVDYAVPQQEDLAVSVYVPTFSGPATYHPTTVQDNYLSNAGDFTGSNNAADFPRTISCWMFVDGIDVHPAAKVKGTVVAFGDSITDGTASDKNANDRWPNILARRLTARSGNTVSVVDEGISGNRVLSDAGTAGVSALARFQRDALGQTGVSSVILMEGINDIGQSFLGGGPTVTIADLKAADRQLIAMAHAAGVKIIGATLTPYEGASYADPVGEKIRKQLNNWILTSGEFDGTIDFAAATANPNDANVFDPKYDSGDHLHPNDAGYTAMADSINLKMLLP